MTSEHLIPASWSQQVDGLLYVNLFR
jgi:hypothetical protein